MLPGPVADQLLQSVSWWETKVADVVRRVKLTQLLLSGALQIRTEARDLFTFPDPLCSIVSRAGRSSLAFACVALVYTGSAVVIANVIVDSFMQAYVPPDIFGRVTSGTGAVMFAMMPVGALLAGGLGTALGVRAALWILTAVIAASGLTFLLTPMRLVRDLPRRAADDSALANPTRWGLSRDVEPGCPPRWSCAFDHRRPQS